jgi:hypothetical protein
MTVVLINEGDAEGNPAFRRCARSCLALARGALLDQISAWIGIDQPAFGLKGRCMKQNIIEPILGNGS